MNRLLAGESVAEAASHEGIGEAEHIELLEVAERVIQLARAVPARERGTRWRFPGIFRLRHVTGRVSPAAILPLRRPSP